MKRGRRQKKRGGERKREGNREGETGTAIGRDRQRHEIERGWEKENK